MKNYLVVRDTLDQILIVDLDKSQVCLDEESSLYLERYFVTDDCADYIGIHVSQIEAEAEAARVLSEWASVSRNQNFVNPDVTVFEICTEETRYRVTRDMPDWIVCYVDYIDPLKDRASKPVEYQYINRRESDGALWPTFCPIQSEGWVQIGKRPLVPAYHSKGDTVLIFDRKPKPATEMINTIVDNTDHASGDSIWIQSYYRYTPGITSIPDELCINFSKGDHLSDAEKHEAMAADAQDYDVKYEQFYSK
jgi:hypothetical protein